MICCWSGNSCLKPNAPCFLIPCCRAAASCKGLMPCTICCHWQTGRREIRMEDCDFLSQILPHCRRLHCPKHVLFDGCHGANSCMTKVETFERGARRASEMTNTLGNGPSEKPLILQSQCGLSFSKKVCVLVCLSSYYFSGWMGILMGQWKMDLPLQNLGKKPLFLLFYWPTVAQVFHKGKLQRFLVLGLYCYMELSYS